MSYPEQVYEAAKRTVVAYGWEPVQEVPDCDIWAGYPEVAFMNTLTGSRTEGISNPTEKRIGIRQDVPPVLKPQVLLHEMSHVKLEHGVGKDTEVEVGEREADLTAKHALHLLGLPFNIARGNIDHATLTPRLKEAAEELARDVYAQIQERAA